MPVGSINRMLRANQQQTIMKPSRILIALALGAFPVLTLAQETPTAPQPPTGGRPGGTGGQPGGPGGQRIVSPLIEALDSNKDGVIDAVEIAQAADSLKKLDKNADGKLTEDEFRPMRPGGQGGPGRGQGGPGQGGPGQGGRGPGGPGGPAPEAPPAQP